VIPATGSPQHMADIVQAGLGNYPDVELRARMVATLDH
jgi:hypothetical protein